MVAAEQSQGKSNSREKTLFPLVGMDMKPDACRYFRVEFHAVPSPKVKVPEAWNSKGGERDPSASFYDPALETNRQGSRIRSQVGMVVVKGNPFPGNPGESGLVPAGQVHPQPGNIAIPQGHFCGFHAAPGCRQAGKGQKKDRDQQSRSQFIPQKWKFHGIINWF
jgi:hypothetical protein